jgi:hypothetical protein
MEGPRRAPAVGGGAGPLIDWGKTRPLRESDRFRLQQRVDRHD